MMGRLFFAAAALLLSGCMLSGGDTFYAGNTGGGGEDFPNTVNRLGKIAAADVNAAADWEQVQNLQLPEIPAISLDSLRVDPPLFKSSGLALGKTFASPDCLPYFWTWDITEFLRYRRIRKITCAEDSIAVRRDTLFYYYAGGPLPATREEFEVKPDSFVTLVGSRGSIVWTGMDKIQYFRCVSEDSVGGLDHGDFLTVQYAPGRQTATIQRVKVYGPDGAYLSPTAPPEEFEYTKLNALGDTLEWKRMRDADGDRAFYARSGAGVVYFERMVRNPDNEPGTARLALVMKARLTHDSVSGDQLKRLYYRDVRLLRAGSIASFSLLGSGADSILRAHDTARVISDTIGAARDSMTNYHGAYTLLLGSDPDSMSTHALLGFGIEKKWRRGPLRASTTSFTPFSPLYPGQGAFTGEMRSTGAYANGDSIFTTGTIRNDGMELEYRGVKAGKEEVYRLLFDLQGNSLGVIPGTKTDGARIAPKRKF
jgi:hypothetical protein